VAGFFNVGCCCTSELDVANFDDEYFAVFLKDSALQQQGIT